MAEGEQADDSQKTEEPSARKLEESRKKGQVALSREMNNWVMLLAATLIIATIAPQTLGHLKNHLRTYFEHAHALPSVPEGFGIVLGQSLWEILGILLLPLLILMVAAFLAPFSQVGPLFAPEIIKPDISKISPLKGFKRLFSMRALVEFAKGILKIGLIGLVGTLILYPFFGQMDHMVGLPVPILLENLQDLVVRMMIGVLIVLFVIAVIDVLYQRWEHYKKMRMTRQETKDEYKQSEGDPQIKGKLRQLRAERARARMMQNVPNADVVITNPTHFAIALKYDPQTMESPQCLAKGVDEVALRIREVAKEHKIEIVENPPLARALYDTMDIDDFIPIEHYRAVAEIISFVFRKQGKLKS